VLYIDLPDNHETWFIFSSRRDLDTLKVFPQRLVGPSVFAQPSQTGRSECSETGDANACVKGISSIGDKLRPCEQDV
jgi:hypothetical protein